MLGNLHVRFGGGNAETCHLATRCVPTLRGGYERALYSDEIEHYISKALTQRLERTNGIVRQLSWTMASATKQVQ